MPPCVVPPPEGARAHERLQHGLFIFGGPADSCPPDHLLGGEHARLREEFFACDLPIRISSAFSRDPASEIRSRGRFLPPECVRLSAAKRLRRFMREMARAFRRPSLRNEVSHSANDGNSSDTNSSSGCSVMPPPPVELHKGNFACARNARQYRLRVKRGEWGDGVRRGGAVADIAADRARVADLQEPTVAAADERNGACSLSNAEVATCVWVLIAPSRITPSLRKMPCSSAMPD